MPPYAVVREKLRKLATDSLPGASLGSEVAIAKRERVSRMTARKAVNSLVAEGLVERRAGVGLFVRSVHPVTRKVRLIAGNLLWDVAMQIAKAVRSETTRNGIELELRDAGGDEEVFLEEIRSLPTSGVAGAVVLNTHDNRTDLALYRTVQAGFPLTVVDRVKQDDGIASVVSDNVRGGRLAADALINAGRDRLVFIGDMAADTVQVRWESFMRRCVERGLSVPRQLDIRDVGRFASWEGEVRALVADALAVTPGPNGFFCSCDAVARFAMRELTARGLSVPDDLSIVGFDDDPIAEWTTPALTTVAQDFPALGLAAVRNLIDRLDGKVRDPTVDIVPVRLVVRDSVSRTAEQ